MWFDQTNATKATIENAQMYQLGMKLGKQQNFKNSILTYIGEKNTIPQRMYISHLLTARFSDSKQEKEDFHSKAAWKFLTQATGIVDPTTFQVSNPSEAM